MALKNPAFLQAARGERPDHTPLWLMRQAGRYLPEYREIRSKVSFLELCRTPELCAEVTLQPIDRFGFDAAILFSDILTVFDAMGVEVEFSPAPKVAAPIRTVADVNRLSFSPAADKLGYVFDAVRACKSALADRVPLIGFCGASLTTASYMIEGSGSKDYVHTKSMAFCEPEVFRDMLTNITTLLIDYLRGQVEAGADALQIFESWGAAFSVEDYRKHILPHTTRLVREAKALGVPVILFLRGNSGLLELAANAGADVIGIGWEMEMRKALDVVGRDKVVQGNFDPIALFAPDEEIERRATDIVAAGREARGHIFNLGHGISRLTDPGKVRHLVDVVHNA